MAVYEISIDKTPEKFFTKHDGTSWQENEQIPCPGGIRIRKRCVGGWQDIELKDGVLKLYFIDAHGAETCVADGILIPQKWNGTAWENIAFSASQVTSFIKEFSITGYDAGSVFDNGIERLEIDFQWRIHKSKQTYRLRAPEGTKVRITAIVHDYQEPGTEVLQDFSDFLGLTLASTTIDQSDLVENKYVFESDGFEITSGQSFFEVDPYLAVNEQATYTVVTCDGYDLYFHQSTSRSSVFEVVASGTTTTMERFDTYFYITSATYYMRNDSNRTITVLLNTPTRSVVQISGVLYSAIDAGASPGIDNVVHTVTIYPDRFTVETNIICPATPATLGAQVTNFILRCNAAGLTNLISYRESAGSEVVSANADIWTNNLYYLQTGDEMNIQSIFVAILTSYAITLTDYYGSASIGLRSITFDVGDNIFVSEFVVDSTTRENGSKLYTLTSRLEQGNQYKDTAIALTAGGAVTSTAQTGFTAIGTDGFASDGAWHWEVL